MEKVDVKTGGRIYEILIESGLYKKLPHIIHEKYNGKKLAVVSDSNVYSLYGRTLAKDLDQLGFFTVPIVFGAGEENKNLDTLAEIYKKLAESEFTRSDLILALGGRVTGDMAGFAAATFLRGMGLVQIPTTLLAMVDSSIGGKVAVDLPQGKNLVGSFYQPDAVYTDPYLLKTLPDRQYSTGMAELLKHGFIRDLDLCSFLAETDNNYEIHSQTDNSFKHALSGKLDEIIAKSCLIKRDVVEEDEKDNGIRQILNFGHTVGHALERVENYKGLTHGEAVSVGMVYITMITEKMGLTKRGEAQKLINALSLYGLPTNMPDIDINELVAAIRMDKKTRSGMITIAYIESMGTGKLYKMKLTELEGRIYDIFKNSAYDTQG